MEDEDILCLTCLGTNRLDYFDIVFSVYGFLLVNWFSVLVRSKRVANEETFCISTWKIVFQEHYSSRNPLKKIPPLEKVIYKLRDVFVDYVTWGQICHLSLGKWWEAKSEGCLRLKWVVELYMNNLFHKNLKF